MLRLCDPCVDVAFTQSKCCVHPSKSCDYFGLIRRDGSRVCRWLCVRLGFESTNLTADLPTHSSPASRKIQHFISYSKLSKVRYQACSFLLWMNSYIGTAVLNLVYTNLGTRLLPYISLVLPSWLQLIALQSFFVLLHFDAPPLINLSYPASATSVLYDFLNTSHRITRQIHFIWSTGIQNL